MSAQIVIVIFGAAVLRDGRASLTLRRRVEAAVAFGRARDRPLYLPTGGIGRFGPSEASVMRDLLIASGVPDGCILLEDSGSDTLSSVRAVRRLLRSRCHAGPVYAASSGYHLPRCVLLLRLAGLHARAAVPPIVPAARSIRQRWYWRLRELPAIPYDAGLLLMLRGLRRL